MHIRGSHIRKTQLPIHLKCKRNGEHEFQYQKGHQKHFKNNVVSVCGRDTNSSIFAGSNSINSRGNIDTAVGSNSNSTSNINMLTEVSVIAVNADRSISYKSNITTIIRSIASCNFSIKIKTTDLFTLCAIYMYKMQQSAKR